MHSAQAADIHSVAVSHEDGRYRMHFVALLAAPKSNVQKLLTDYEHLQRISPQIRETSVLTRERSTALVRTVIEDCILIFCRRLTQVEALRLEGDSIFAQVVPAESDFRFGMTHWQLSSQDDKTRLQYDSEIEPDFWVPPLIGPWLLKRKFRQRLEQSIQRLEQLAATGP